MVVSRTPAQITRHARAHLIGSWMGIAREQAFGAHQLTGCAKTALRCVVRNEGLLQGIEAAVAHQTFDGLYRPAIRPYSQIAARINRLAVEKYSAGSAFAPIAADLRTRKVEVVSQKFHQRPA